MNATGRVAPQVTAADSPKAWRVLLGASLVTCVGLGPMWAATVGLFLQPFQQELGWSRSEIGFANTIQALIAPIIVTVAGVLIDRWPLRRLILWGVVLQALNIAAFSQLGGSVWNYYALVAAIAVFGAAASPIAMSKVVQNWFNRHLGRALGVVFAASALGAMLNPPLAQVLIASFGWRDAYLVLAAISLLVGGAAAYLYIFDRHPSRGESLPLRPAGAASPTWAGADVVYLLRQRAWWSLALWNAPFGFAVAGVAFHFAPLLQDRGMSAADSALALSAFAFGRLFGDLAAGWMVDKFAARRLAVGVVLVPILALAALLDENAGNLFTALAVGFLLGTSSGADGCLSAYLTQKYFGAEVYGQAFATQLMAATLAGGAAPWLAGLSYERFGNYHAALLAGMAAFACAAFAALALPKLPEESLTLPKRVEHHR